MAHSLAGTMVKHFTDMQWVDFARNLTSPRAKTAMQQHIDSGCKKCSKIVRTWQGLVSVAAGEGAFVPPAYSVHLVKSQFAAVWPAKSSGVRLVFDSLLQPATAGTRGSMTARQFLYETDEYYIDLRVEPRTEADRSAVTGQVLHRIGAERTAPALTVQLQDGTRPLAQTATNEFGEFQIEFEAAGSLWLAISRGKSHEVVVLPLYGIEKQSKNTPPN